MITMFKQLGIEESVVMGLVADLQSGKIKDQNELMVKIMQMGVLPGAGAS